MVFDLLRPTYEDLFRDEESTSEAPRLRHGGYTKEKMTYEPLTHFLNTVVDAANTHLTHVRYLQHLHFKPYDVDMANILDSEKPLKPDILGLLCPPSPDVPKILIIHLSSSRLSRTRMDSEASSSIWLEYYLFGTKQGFGLDSTRVDQMFHLNGCYYAIVRTIQNHDSIREHATAVYSLKLQTTDIPDIPEWQSRELTLVDRVDRTPQLPRGKI
ncbi:hypothetical protein EDB87DRAFT_1655767, partial [Lactarius vividus]